MRFACGVESEGAGPRGVDGCVFGGVVRGGRVVEELGEGPAGLGDVGATRTEHQACAALPIKKRGPFVEGHGAFLGAGDDAVSLACVAENGVRGGEVDGGAVASPQVVGVVDAGGEDARAAGEGGELERALRVAFACLAGAQEPTELVARGGVFAGAGLLEEAEGLLGFAAVAEHVGGVGAGDGCAGLARRAIERERSVDVAGHVFSGLPDGAEVGAGEGVATVAAARFVLDDAARAFGQRGDLRAGAAGEDERDDGERGD